MWLLSTASILYFCLTQCSKQQRLFDKAAVLVLRSKTAAMETRQIHGNIHICHFSFGILSLDLCSFSIQTWEERYSQIHARLGKVKHSTSWSTTTLKWFLLRSDVVKNTTRTWAGCYTTDECNNNVRWIMLQSSWCETGHQWSNYLF